MTEISIGPRVKCACQDQSYNHAHESQTKNSSGYAPNSGRRNLQIDYKSLGLTETRAGNYSIRSSGRGYDAGKKGSGLSSRALNAYDLLGSRANYSGKGNKLEFSVN